MIAAVRRYGSMCGRRRRGGPGHARRRRGRARSRRRAGLPGPAHARAFLARCPADVCIPDGFTDIAVDYFDDYSWRAFVALVWPAEPGRRGVAASTKGIAAAGPRVFETYKSLWEIFHGDGSAPEPAFDAYDAAAHNPCAVSRRRSAT